MSAQARKSGLKRLTGGEWLIIVVFLLVLAAVAFVVYSESGLRASFFRAQPRISLGAGGLGMFIYTLQAGYFAGVENRLTTFEASPKTDVRIVSLNGKAVGAASGTERTDRSGRIVVVVKAAAEGPVTLKGTDVESGISATVIQMATAN